MNESALPRVLLSRASDLRRSYPVYVRGTGEWRDAVALALPRVLLSVTGEAISEGASALSM